MACFMLPSAPLTCWSRMACFMLSVASPSTSRKPITLHLTIWPTWGLGGGIVRGRSGGGGDVIQKWI